MKRKLMTALIAFCGAMLAGPDMSAQLNYIFTYGEGDRLEGGMNQVDFETRTGASGWGLLSDWRTLDIGFTFSFDGNDYDQLTTYHNAVVALGSNNLSNPNGNDLDNAGAPVIAPMWDEMRLADGEGGACPGAFIQYGTFGSEPNRVFVIEYVGMSFGSGGNGFYSSNTTQLRLYEGTNKIEFWYDDITGQAASCSQWGGSMSTNATIGIGSGGDEFLSVTPSSSPTASRTVSNNSIDFLSSQITSGTLYTFCPAGLTGDPDQGGTADMTDGDTLLLGRQVKLSATEFFNPFTHFNLCSETFTYTISGPAAADYQINPSDGEIGDGQTPTLSFRPSTLGIRYATLNVRDNGGVNRTYVLAAQGIPRTTWTGDVSQGGTPQVLSGDTLLKGIVIPNNTVESFTPLTISVEDGSGPAAPITFTLIDPRGTFSIDPTSANVEPGGSVTPVITLAPVLKVGWQEATLRVNAEGEVRTYLLRFFSSGSGARFYYNAEEIVAGASLFRNDYACVGTTTTIPIDVQSIGDLPFQITTDDAFLTETTIGPGTPPYELLRDEFGDYINSPDFFVSDAAGNPLQLPLTISPLATERIYLTFVPSRTGSRRTRAFFSTNGTNFTGLDVNTATTIGMLNFELVGYGIGSGLSNEEGTGLPKPIVFPPTKLRDTATMTGYLYNSGECDLIIDGDDFRLVSGDVGEFKIVEMFPGLSPNGLGEYTIVPGDTVSYTVSFMPSRSGSRLASIRVESNDSTVQIDGVTERGSYYIDVFGTGQAALDARPARLSPAVIDGPNGAGAVTLENNSGGFIQIIDLQILGSTEIVRDPARPWPTLPINVDPGKKLDLGLLLAPDAGSTPGMRTATLEVTLSNGEILLVDISGLAGTRSVVAVPTSMFQGVRVPVGTIARQYLAVSNNGTLPVRVSSMTIGGANPLDYRVSPIVRATIEPGSTEFFEVTYSPRLLGMSSAELTIVTNSTNGTPIGTHTVTLGGEGASTKMEGSDPSGSTETPGESPAIRPSLGSGGYAAMMASGTSLWQSTPNPASGRVEIRYALPVAQSASIELYDMDGRVVRTLVEGEAGAGEQVLTADVSGLPSGRYYYMLRTSEGTLALALDIVK